MSAADVEQAEPALPCPHCQRNPKAWRDTYPTIKNTQPGWAHPRTAPYKPWAEVLPSGAYWVRHRFWLDHLYRLRFRDGRVVFVAEPYELEPPDLADLAQLAEDGWHVAIDGRGFHHDTTLRVLIERERRGT